MNEAVVKIHKPRILAILPSLLPSAMIYTVRPLTELAKQQKVDFEYVLEPKATAAQVQSQDLVIFVRNDDARYNFLLEETRERHISTIYDLDDNLWVLPENNPAKRYHLDTQILQLEHYLRSVDLVKVYNPIVRDKVKANFNRSVFQALAGIDVRLAPAQRPATDGSKIRIAYATARGAKDELYPLIIPDLKRILQDFPEQVELVLWRDAPEELQGFTNITILPVERDYENFLRSLASAGYDIGLAPMLSDEFYTSKTNTKFRDYGVARIAGIYSDVAVYAEVQDGATGLRVRQEPGAWYDAMVRLIKDKQLRGSIQAAGYQYACDHFRQELMEAEWVRLIERLVPPDNLDTQTVKVWGSTAAEKQKVFVQLSAAGGISGNRAVLERLDRPGEQVDVDLDRPLPLESDVVDAFFADESLETADNLSAALHEVYRVCKHGAQVCVVARYGHHHQNLADPQVRQVFDEFTPRFWTNSPFSRVYPKLLGLPDQEPWGLLKETSPSIDFRCVRMEFFYQREYRGQTAEERRKARQKFGDVCDLIKYSLLVVKSPVSEEEMDKLEEQFDYSDPQPVIVRKYQERSEALQEQVDKLQVTLREKNLEVDRWMNVPYKLKANQLLEENNRIKSNRWVRLALRFTQRTDAMGSLPPAMAPLVTTSRSMYKKLAGFRLRPSLNLQTVNFLTYPVVFNKPNLQEILLAFNLDLPLTQGLVGIDLFNSQGQSVAKVTVPYNEVTEKEPVVFKFPPVAETGGGEFGLRIYSRNVDAPVHIYELYKYGMFGLGSLERKLFAAFRFAGK